MPGFQLISLLFASFSIGIFLSTSSIRVDFLPRQEKPSTASPTNHQPVTMAVIWHSIPAINQYFPLMGIDFLLMGIEFPLKGNQFPLMGNHFPLMGNKMIFH